MVKSIKTVAIGAALVLGLSFAAVMPAIAATIPGYYDAIFDGQDEVTLGVNGTIDVNAFIEVDAGEVLYAVSTDVIGSGDNLPRQCHTFSPIQGAQSTEKTFDHEVGSNTGDFGFRVNGYVASNMNEANALQDVGDGCNGAFDTLYNQSDVVHIVPSGSSSNNDLGSVSYWQGLIADLTKQVNCLISGQDYDAVTKQCKAKPVVKPAYCAQASTYTAWYGQTGPNVSAYQSFLISNGFSIPAGATGYFGNQTQAAAGAMSASCSK